MLFEQRINKQDNLQLHTIIQKLEKFNQHVQNPLDVYENDEINKNNIN